MLVQPTIESTPDPDLVEVDTGTGETYTLSIEQRNDLEYVIFSGGGLDGQVRQVAPPADVFRIAVRNGSERWTEAYIYTDQTVEHPEHGTIRVMSFMERVGAK